VLIENSVRVLLWLALIVMVAMFVWARPRLHRMPKRRPYWVRAACGATAMVILLVVGAATWSTAESYYQVGEDPESISASTNPTPSLKRSREERALIRYIGLFDSPLIESGGGPSMTIPPGYQLARHVGVSSLALMFAALLGAQVFRQRNIAFAWTLLASVLYVVVLDRMVVDIHAAHLRSANIKPEHRAVAQQMLNTSFFFKDTASKQ
jgi:hypothetical protein